MRFRALCGVIVGVLLTLSACSTGEVGAGAKLAQRPDTGPTVTVERLPNIELTWLRGGRDGDDPVRLDSLTGQPLVLNVWAQWCDPCRDEAPYVQDLYERSDQKLRVIGLDYADQAEGAEAFIDELGLTYPQLYDPKGLVKAPFGLTVGIPVTVFARSDGQIVHIARKPYPSAAALRADVETYLGVRV